MIDPKVYTLLKVNECGSFVSAASELGISQPAVSQHIKALEDELGVAIFDRGKGKLVLTTQGEEVIKAAKKLTGIYTGLRQSIEDGTSLTTHMTVGVTHTAESNPIARAIASYCSQNPKVYIKMITDSINNLYSMLRTYEIDIAIVEGRIRDDNIRYICLDNDCLMLAVSPNHPLAKKSIVTLSELRKERMILRLPNSGTRNLFISHLESNNMNINDFNVILEVDNIATIKDLIRSDFGVSILAKSACLDELKKGKIVSLPVENLSMVREINIAYPKDFTRFDLLEELVKSYNSIVQTYR